jgi:hypothetical protein
MGLAYCPTIRLRCRLEAPVSQGRAEQELAGRESQVALKLHLVLKAFKLRFLSTQQGIGNGSDRVLVRTTYVRVIRLENWQTFTGFVSSNLTLSATFQGEHIHGSQ